jgi:hypothetical protein
MFFQEVPTIFTFEGEFQLWEFQHFTKYLQRKNDGRMILEWNYPLAWYIFLDALGK